MRVKALFSPSDDPGAVDGVPSAPVRALFDYLAPGVANPRIDENHAGIAIAALNPELALQLARISRFMALDLEWCARADLRELAIAAVNTHFGCTRGLNARAGAWDAAGISREAIAALPEWRDTALLDDEQRLVVEYTCAAVTGAVPKELFARVVARFGEKGAVELTSVIGLWSAWAMLLNAVAP